MNDLKLNWYLKQIYLFYRYIFKQKLGVKKKDTLIFDIHST